MRSHSHLNTVKQIIQIYDGKLPLAAWLKQFFKSEKKFGSTDRKQIAHLCYCFYRLGNSFPETEVEERILTGVFLCTNSSNRILEELRPEWNNKIALPLAQKLAMLSSPEGLSVFPFPDELSAEITPLPFHLSFLVRVKELLENPELLLFGKDPVKALLEL